MQLSYGGKLEAVYLTGQQKPLLYYIKHITRNRK